MPKQSSWYEKGSPADVIVQLASSSWNVIKPLTESQLLSEKLLGYNSLTFTFVCGFAITHLFVGEDSVFSLVGLLFFVLSIFLAFVISNPYIKIMILLTNLTKDKISTLRNANVILLAGLPLASGGLLFNAILLTKIALGIVAIQVFFVLIGMLFPFSTTRSEDQRVNPSDFKEITGNIQFFITIIEFIMTVLLFASAVIKGQLF